MKTWDGYQRARADCDAARLTLSATLATWATVQTQLREATLEEAADQIPHLEDRAATLATLVESQTHRMVALAAEVERLRALAVDDDLDPILATLTTVADVMETFGAPVPLVGRDLAAVEALVERLQQDADMLPKEEVQRRDSANVAVMRVRALLRIPPYQEDTHVTATPARTPADARSMPTPHAGSALSHTEGSTAGNEGRIELTGFFGQLFDNWYPRHFAVGVIDDEAEARRAVADLEAAGLGQEDVRLFSGAEVTRIDLRVRAQRNLIQRVTAAITSGTDEGMANQVYLDEARRGHTIVVARVGDSKTADPRVVPILRAHHAHSISFYGDRAIEEI
jgi:hypothetical protein